MLESKIGVVSITVGATLAADAGLRWLLVQAGTSPGAPQIGDLITPTVSVVFGFGASWMAYKMNQSKNEKVDEELKAACRDLGQKIEEGRKWAVERREFDEKIADIRTRTAERETARMDALLILVQKSVDVHTLEQMEKGVRRDMRRAQREMSIVRARLHHINNYLQRAEFASDYQPIEIGADALLDPDDSGI